MKLIRNCSECGFYRITSSTNYIFRGAAICAYRSKKLTSTEIPEWCHMQETGSTIEILKNALKVAILTKQRVVEIVYHDDYTSGPDCADYSLDWTDEVKEWAKLCNLNLKDYDPFFYEDHVEKTNVF